MNRLDYDAYRRRKEIRALNSIYSSSTIPDEEDHLFKSLLADMNTKIKSHKKPQQKEDKTDKKVLDPKEDYTGVYTLGGNKFRYVNGKLHSKRYPAIERSNGECEFYWEGERVTFSVWKKNVGDDFEARAKEIETAQLETIKAANKTIAELKTEVDKLNQDLSKYGQKAKEEPSHDWYSKIEVD